MRAAVAGSRRDILRRYHAHDFGTYGVILDIDHMHSRRTQPGHQQVATLDMRMRRIGTKRGAAGVPTEVMQLIAKPWHLGAADYCAVGLRLRI